MLHPAGFLARRAAFRILETVLSRGQTLDYASKAAMRGLSQHADQALSRAISAEVLRWLVDLDELIDSATKKRLTDDAKPRMVLRIMLAQYLRLETKPHAVIATCLPLLAGGPRRLAHGVFSTLIKQDLKLPDAPSLPEEAQMRWEERGESIAAGLAEPPALDLTLRDGETLPEWAAEKGGVSLVKGHVRLPRGSKIEELPGFKEGEWWVQDLAASLPARLLGEGKGRRVLDLAAAPGGKTLQLAANGWDVTALDISGKRLEMLRENLARTGLKAEVVCANALEWSPKEPFDAILLDAPCTATGTCRRHPEVLHRINHSHIGEMAELQSLLLSRAAKWLKADGQLVYAVCSLEEEEGEQQASEVALTLDPIKAEELPEGLAPDEEGHLRTDPGMLAEQGGLDGFFIARWKA